MVKLLSYKRLAMRLFGNHIKAIVTTQPKEYLNNNSVNIS